MWLASGSGSKKKPQEKYVGCDGMQDKTRDLGWCGEACEDSRVLSVWAGSEGSPFDPA